jgi:MFS family permease
LASSKPLLKLQPFFSPSTIAFFLGSLLSAPLAAKIGRRALFVGMGVFAVGLLVSVLTGFAGGQSLMALRISVILQGFGQGLVIPLLLNIVLSTVTNAEAGMASGIFSIMQIAESACGVTLVGIILFGIVNYSDVNAVSPLGGVPAYDHAFAVATVYNLIAVVFGLAIFSRLKTSNPIPNE